MSEWGHCDVFGLDPAQLSLIVASAGTAGTFVAKKAVEKGLDVLIKYFQGIVDKTPEPGGKKIIIYGPNGEVAREIVAKACAR